MKLTMLRFVRPDTVIDVFYFRHELVISTATTCATFSVPYVESEIQSELVLYSVSYGSHKPRRNSCHFSLHENTMA